MFLAFLFSFNCVAKNNLFINYSNLAEENTVTLYSLANSVAFKSNIF